MDPDGLHPFHDVMNELSDAEQTRFIERLDDRGATVVKPADREAGEACCWRSWPPPSRGSNCALLAAHERRHAADTPGWLDALAFDDSDSGERLRAISSPAGGP